MFIKLSFLPFVISSIIAFFLRIFYEFEIKRSLFKLLQFVSVSFIFTLLWNFPIIGRIPKILYAAIFTRNDTLNFGVFNEFFKNFFTFYLDKKFFFNFNYNTYNLQHYFLLKFIIKVITSKFVTKDDVDLYFCFWFITFLSFNYTLLNTAENTSYSLMNQELATY